MEHKRGIKQGRAFDVSFEKSEVKSRICKTCQGPVRRSWLTGILHKRCRFCRYLVMMYGPNIGVSRVPKGE
jgi:hypothetical protein